ncbi:cupin domain-containing protein [Azohydromonas caseinilytica]|uniref:Cupin domain-containing protein n=1 Tax=Azohydromonas caseinilytica TaxID=2728836 RepID=A0A848F793_9BURK|nr:cupin domain-containing protein [Azohydromonas caseinilytica]NML14213.1 cupin domain-containing protein [Azohydromonas caseinilytica]
MQIDQPMTLLGGISPATFMRRHWQKKPLLVRQALPGVQPPVTRAEMFALAQQEDVESRLIVAKGEAWKLRHGPLPRQALPAVKQPRWTLLVQGLDLHAPAAHEMLSRFRFVPQARLDDLMISWASEGGGVGPHMDNYDVFLVQVHGKRRWRIGPVADDTLVEGVPLKILANFEPQEDVVLEPGDMLYLPPRWGHDGIAVDGECMTCSVGFRVPREDELARELLQRLPELMDEEEKGRLYRDPKQPATDTPGLVPPALADFARRALERALKDPELLQAALGEILSEPKPNVWFEQDGEAEVEVGVALHRRSRMMYDEKFVFINGESFHAGGRDARLMRRLADAGTLSAREVAALSSDARGLLEDWAAAGWVQPLRA